MNSLSHKGASAQKIRAFGWANRTSAIALVATALAIPQTAFAQEEPEAAAPGEEIVVTGSRIGRSTFNSPTPVTVIGAETIQALGQVNIGETIQTLPQNLSKATETNTGLNAIVNQYNVGASIADLRGLNPQFGVRTLTLVDTHRFVPSTTGGAVDMNLVPSMLVKSVETVTGGASAAYGTDALAGVINVLLDKQLSGIKAQIDYGQTSRGDGAAFHADFAAGTSFAGGKGHAIFGVEYQKSDPVGDCVYVRDWCAKSPDTFLNEQNATNGLTRYIRGTNSAYANYALTTVLRTTPGGARSNTVPLRGLYFSDDGKKVLQFDQGLFNQASGFGDRQGGTCSLDCSPWSEVQLRPEIKRLASFARAEYELTPSLKVFGEASYGFRDSSVAGISLGPSSGTPIRSDYFWLNGVTYFDQTTGTNRPLSGLIAANPSNAASVAGLSQAPGVPNNALFIAKHMRNVPGARQTVYSKLDSYRGLIGLEGDFNFLDGWKWDAYYQYGKTEQHVRITGNRVNRFFMYALDAVDQGLATTGIANGKVVCRATLPGPANTSTPAGFEQHWNQADAAGCVPLNILGKNTEDPAAIAYAYRDANEWFNYQQHVAAFNTSGDVFQGWAGPISLALGGEYRFEKGFARHDTLPFNVTNTNSPFGNDFGGSLKILEGYVETNIPIVRDVPAFKLVELNAAWRHTHQTNTDQVFNKSKTLDFDTWKVSGTWDVTDWLRFRGTRSRDVRAASFVDLYYNLPDVLPGPPAGTAFNPWDKNAAGVSANDFALVQYPPNFALTPEIGNTWTAGVILKPGGALDGLRVSVDYYDIKIRDAIVTLTTQQVVDACFTATVVCESIFDPAGTSFDKLTDAQRKNFDKIVRGSSNIGSFHQAGWDVEIDYRLPLDRIKDSLPGVFSFRGLATITDKMEVNLGNGSGSVSYLNQTGGSAFGGFTAPSKYILTGFATYAIGGFSITADGRYIPKGIYDIRRNENVPATDLNSINDNSVDSKFYTGLSASYKFDLTSNSSAEVFASVRNLFDVDPPFTASNTAGTLGMVQGGGAPTNPVFYDTLGQRWRAGVRIKY